MEYISSEQYIQACKAKYFGDNDTLIKILGSTTLIECKDLSRNIRNYSESKWERVAGNLCHPGIRAKFEQNPLVLNTLLTKTRKKHIVECASDRLWGTGLPLSDPDCLDCSKWISQGILGQILEDIHNEFKGTDRGHRQSQYVVSPPQPVVNAAAITKATISAVNQPITQALHEAVSSGVAPNHLEAAMSTSSVPHTSRPKTPDDPLGKNMEVA